VLLRVLGGTVTVSNYLARLSVSDVMVATTEKEMGQDELVQYRNWATPEAMAQLLRILHEGRGLSPRTREILMEFLIQTSTGPRRIKALLPANTRVAHKTGSSRTVLGLTRATNDAGIVTLPDGRHFSVSVFVADSAASEADREAVIGKIARAAWDYWAK